MNELQNILEESVNRLFAERVDRAFLARCEDGEWPAELWALATEQGLTHVLASEAAGGMNAGWAEAFIVVRACGRHAVPLPVPEQLLALWLVERAGISAPSGLIALLPEVLNADANGHYTLEVPRVPWGRAAQFFVGLTSTHQIALFDTQFVSVTPAQNLAREPRDTVHLRAASPLALGSCDLNAHAIRWLGALLRAGQIAGAAATCLELSVKSTSDRVQFGRPLSQFQAIQNHLAEIAGAMASIDTMACTAFLALDNRGLPNLDLATASFEIAAAKCRASDAVELLTRLSHQVHGAIGFTYEYDLQFLTRRLWSWRAEFGTSGEWGEHLGRAATAIGGDGLWAQVTR